MKFLKFYLQKGVVSFIFSFGFFFLLIYGKNIFGGPDFTTTEKIVWWSIGICNEILHIIVAYVLYKRNQI